ncbi:MAG: RNA polymerase sigma factor [Thermodesulfobacteriota bacterium]
MPKALAVLDHVAIVDGAANAGKLHFHRCRSAALKPRPDRIHRTRSRRRFQPIVPCWSLRSAAWRLPKHNRSPATSQTRLARGYTQRCRHRETEPAKLLPLEDYLPRHEEGGHPQIFDWTDRPEEALLSKESREKMLEALEKLPADYRAVFILRDMEGFSNAETGETLGLSVGAVKSRLHRARLTLRGLLQNYFEKEGV